MVPPAATMRSDIGALSGRPQVNCSEERRTGTPCTSEQATPCPIPSWSRLASAYTTTAIDETVQTSCRWVACTEGATTLLIADGVKTRGIVAVRVVVNGPN